MLSSVLRFTVTAVRDRNRNRNRKKNVITESYGSTANYLRKLEAVIVKVKVRIQ